MQLNNLSAKKKSKAKDQVVSNASDNDSDDSAFVTAASDTEKDGIVIDDDNDVVSGGENGMSTNEELLMRLKSKGSHIMEKANKAGIVYLARLPPFMRPDKIRHLLSQYAEVSNMYLEEEDESFRKQRIKRGGSRKKRFVHGWVEFANKKDAKSLAEKLNGEKVIKKKSNNFWAEDTWSMKYLPGFKWYHLTEKRMFEKKIRALKLKKEMKEARKENETFIKKVHQSHMLEKKLKKKGNYQEEQEEEEQGQVDYSSSDIEQNNNNKSKITTTQSKKKSREVNEDDEASEEQQQIKKKKQKTIISRPLPKQKAVLESILS